MKPCLNPNTIRRIMDYHQAMSQFHYERMKVMEEYLAELQKPGFKIPGNYIITGTTRNAEKFVTLAGDTFGETDKSKW